MIHQEDEWEWKGPADRIIAEVGSGRGMGMQRHKKKPRRQARGEG